MLLNSDIWWSFQESAQELGMWRSGKAQVKELYMFKAIVLKAFWDLKNIYIAATVNSPEAMEAYFY